MKIALDNVSKKVQEKLGYYGHTVVYNATDEHDELWFSRALKLGAEVFISLDNDIDVLCNRLDKPFIRLKQNMKHDKVFKHIIASLKEIKHHANTFRTNNNINVNLG